MESSLTPVVGRLHPAWNVMHGITVFSVPLQQEGKKTFADGRKMSRGVGRMLAVGDEDDHTCVSR
jgi:hypothetical protein